MLINSFYPARLPHQTGKSPYCLQENNNLQIFKPASAQIISYGINHPHFKKAKPAFGNLSETQKRMIKETKALSPERLNKLSYIIAARDMLANKKSALEQRILADPAEIPEDGGKKTTLSKKHVTMDRETFRNIIAEKIYNEDIEKRKRDGKAIIVIGISGGGKSTLVRRINENFGGLFLDHDEIKDHIPEFSYDNNREIPDFPQEKIFFPDLVHPESLIIQDKALEKGLKNKDNVIIHISGRKKAEIEKMKKDFKEAGYNEVDLVAIDVPREEAARRSVQRFINKGRFLDPDFVYKKFLCDENNPEKGLLPLENFHALKNGFDRVALYSNMVKEGEPPILIEGTPFISG